ncbi:MAG: hypothetical protein CVU77_02900 [Elusimicrobia bacterium HGW-Elusimicrobia-1]|nr:MAG: hypothetical protein CVU77_02900 [Elusimicrobia bacterium HGW-Elusimicrobia-1]
MFNNICGKILIIQLFDFLDHSGLIFRAYSFLLSGRLIDINGLGTTTFNQFIYPSIHILTKVFFGFRRGYDPANLL